MNNTYYIKNRKIKELLDNVQEFIINMSKFNDRHQGYSYTIDISKNEELLWDCKLEFKNEKQNNKTTSN